MQPSLSSIPGVKPAADFNHVIGIQGEPNAGKTTAATSWPNPLVLNFDKKLRPGILEVPFWNQAWVNEYMRLKPPLTASRSECLIKWLRAEGPKLPADITLVLDSFTMVEASWTEYVNNNRHVFYTKGGGNTAPEYNQRAMFAAKQDYFIELFALLKSTSCPVVVTFHETIARNDKGQPTGKFRTLVSGGAFKDQLEGNLGMLIRLEQVKARRILYVRSTDVFDAMIAPCYSIPADVSQLDITDSTAFAALERYKISAPAAENTQSTTHNTN